MELRHLRYFCAVADTLHFSRAAERLRLSQPALSRQIRDLENEVGVPLIRRHGTQTALTPAGAVFWDRARAILVAADNAIVAARGLGRQIRFGHYGTLWIDYYSAGLRAFAKRHPGYPVQPVELTPVELVSALRTGELDFALVGMIRPETGREFATRRLSTVDAVIALAADHPLAKRRRLDLGDLRDADWISWDQAAFPGRFELLQAAAKQAGFVPRVVGSLDSVASIFVAVSTSRAVGYVLPMSKRLPHAGIVFSHLRPPGITLEMHAAWRRDSRHSALLAELADTLAS